VRNAGCGARETAEGGAPPGCSSLPGYPAGAVPIFLARHGETEANAVRVVQRPEAPLSARGGEQAERLARRLAGEGVAAVLSSDLARAAATAERVAAAAGATLELEPLLRERDYGEIRGRPYAELEREGVSIFAPDYAPPGGETWEAFFARVDRAWARIQEVAARTPGPVAVVTHGLVKHAIATRHLSALRENAPGRIVPFANTALTVLEGPPWEARLVGCTAHLAEGQGDEGTTGGRRAVV